MIASLDVGRKQAVLEGYKLLERTLMLADELRQQINATGAFRVLELQDLLPEEVKDDQIMLDPTKITVDISSCGLTVDELQQELFTRFNITVEKSTFNTITLLLTIGTTRSKCSRLYDALMRIAREKRAPRRSCTDGRGSEAFRRCARGHAAGDGRAGGGVAAVDGAVGGWAGLADPRAFYLARVARFRRRVREAARAGDEVGCELAVRCTLSAVAACRELGAGPEAEALTAGDGDVWA